MRLRTGYLDKATESLDEALAWIKQAKADGKPVSVGLMNYNLIGVALPAGARAIQLRFTDAAYETGKVVTIVALLAALIVWIGGGVLDRRAAAPTQA